MKADSLIRSARSRPGLITAPPPNPVSSADTGAWSSTRAGFIGAGTLIGYPPFADIPDAVTTVVAAGVRGCIREVWAAFVQPRRLSHLRAVLSPVVRFV